MAKKFYIEDGQEIPAIKYADSKPDGYSLITDENLIHELTKNKYNLREEDGREYYNNFRSDRYIDILNGVYTESQVFDLENHLKNLGIEIVSGNWLTAQNTLNNLNLSGIFDQTMKNELTNFIQDYINTNY